MTLLTHGKPLGWSFNKWKNTFTNYRSRKVRDGKVWQTSSTATFTFYTMQSDILLSLRGTNRQIDSRTQSLVSHPGEWKPGCPINPEVAASIGLWPLAPFALRLAKLPVQRLKKIRKGNKGDLYWGWCSWTAGALSERKNFYYHLDIKSCERGTLFHKRGWSVVWYS